MDIVKKSTKWKCRVCNIKQTFRKEYFRGNGTECRIKVQELNLSKGQKQNETVHNYLDLLNADESEFLEDNKDEITEMKCANVNNYKQFKVEESFESTCENSTEINFEQDYKQIKSNHNFYKILNENEKDTLERNTNEDKQSLCNEIDTYKKSKWTKFEQDQKQIRTVLELLNDDENKFLENDHKENSKIRCTTSKKINNSPIEQEASTFFNFSQTRKWSAGTKSMQNDVKETKKKNVLDKSNPPKKSKWDNYM